MSSQSFSRRLRYLLPGLAFAGLAALLVHPETPQLYKLLRGTIPAEWTFFDRACRFGYLAHSSAYFVASLTAFAAFPPFRRSGRRVAAAIYLHGIASESLQLLVPGRDFDILDLLCNLTAITVAALTARLFVAKPHEHAIESSPAPAADPPTQSAA